MRPSLLVQTSRREKREISHMCGDWGSPRAFLFGPPNQMEKNTRYAIYRLCNLYVRINMRNVLSSSIIIMRNFGLSVFLLLFFFFFFSRRSSLLRSLRAPPLASALLRCFVVVFSRSLTRFLRSRACAPPASAAPGRPPMLAMKVG